MTGRAVINAAFPPGCYTNHLHRSGSQQASGGTFAYPAVLDVNGYPASSPDFNILESINLLRSTSGYTGAWVMGWTGQLGGFRLNLSSGAGLTVTTGSSFVSQGANNNDFSGNNGRVGFTFNGADTAPTCYFIPGTYDGTLANLYLCREDEEALYLSGVHIRPEYKSILTYLDPLIIRLTPINMNGSNLTRWGYKHSLSSFSYANSRWCPGAWAGTIGGTDTYTCSSATDTPVSWTDGEAIQGYVTNANTSATPTLDCGSRGAKTIVDEYGAAPSVGAIGALSLKTFIYDALLDKVLVKTGGVQTGTPVEIEVELANSLSKPWWFQVPLMASDAYILAMAQYLYANMQQWFALELSNEVWNFGAGFSQTSIAVARGAVLGFDSGNNRQYQGYYAKRFCEMVDIFKTVFGSDTRLRPTIGIQMFGSPANYDAYRFLGTDLGSYGFNSAPNRPIDKATYVSPASYIQGGQIRAFDAGWNNTMTEALAAADDYDSGDATRMAAALLWVDGDLRAGTRNATPGPQTVLAVNEKAAEWDVVVDGYGKEILEYEGSLEIAAPSISRLTALSVDTGYAAKFSTLIEAYKNSHFAKKLIMDRMQGIMALPSYAAPAAFEDVNDNQWALRRTLYATAYKTEEGFSKFSLGYLNLRLGTLA